MISNRPWNKKKYTFELILSLSLSLSSVHYFLESFQRKFQVFKNVFLTHKTGGKCEKEKSQF